MSFTICQADLKNPNHQLAIVQLLDMYCRDAMGGGKPLADDSRARLIPALQSRSDTLILLAFSDGKPVGLCTCFEGFSTFMAKPLLNVHDLAVHPAHRGRGIGRSLLMEAETLACESGYCKLTLEVRADNPGAQHLYRSLGFAELTPVMHFWNKTLPPENS